MTRKNKYLIDLIILTAVMILVPIVFKVFTERKVAALIAGTMFVGSASFLLFHEYLKFRKLPLLWTIATVQFLAIFALPIWITRIWFWNESFDNFRFFGIPGPQFHHMSTVSFMVMWVATAVVFGFEYYQQRQLQK